MKNKRKAKRILTGMLALQLVFFVGVGTYVQNVYAEETVKSQTEEKEYPEKNDKNQVEEDSTEIENNQDEGILEDFSQQEEQTVIVEENRDAENQQSLENEPVEMELQEPVLTYKTHVSSIGWQKSVTNGEVAGTTGRALSVEALQMDLEMPDNIEGGIEYAAHVSNIGWQKSVTNGEVAGTTGKAKFIEALKINLTGEIAATYDIYYRVHSSDIGWLGWAKNGEYAGSTGYAKAVEAVEIRICKKDAEDKPVQEQKSYKAETNRGRVIYQAHMQDVGWMSNVIDGDSAGLPDGSKDLQALRVTVADDLKEYGQISGSVIYQAHVEDIGWQDEVKDGQIAGTVGKNKQIEAVRVKLTEQLAQTYDIYYRVNVEGKGWLDWTVNGGDAGSTGLDLAVRGIEIKICAKDGEEHPEVGTRALVTSDNFGNIVYQAHVQKIGWEKQVADGETAGTVGKGLAMEGLRISYQGFGENPIIEGSVIYQAHVSNVGWQSEVSDNQLAGTEGKNQQIEAVKIRLSGALDEKYDIYYRAHIANYGWLSWTKNGETAGSTGYGCAIEGIEIKLYPKNSVDVPETGRSALTREDIPKIEGQVHVSGDGWKEAQNAGQLLGTTGQNKGIEAVALSVKSNENQYTGGIEYQAHVQDIGWQTLTGNGNIAGTTGQGKHIEAMRIKLTGDLAKYVDVYYRMHVANFGWLGWAKNGQDAGTSGYGYQVEAMQIKLVPKNTAAPGSTSNVFKKAPPRVENEMQARANFYSSSTPYLILVNRSTHKVGVFRGWQGSWQNVFYWDCSDGAPSTPTVEGIFTVGIRGYYFDSGASRCYWYTQFRGNYLFHSVLYNKNGTLRDGRLGMPLSHGCVRLDINNAKWIYDNIPSGTTVVVYH